MELGLAGKRVVITGGTRGIGRAIAEAFSNEGASVALCARNEEQVKHTVAALTHKGISVHGQALDISDHTALRQWINNAAHQLGGIDIVIANPSAFGVGASGDDWKAGYAVDLMGTVTMIEAAMPYLETSSVNNGSASILILSSAAVAETDMESAYGAYKAALIHYAKGLARRLAPQGLRVNTISPGTIYVEDGFWGNAKRHMPELYGHYLARNPMGRMGHPEEIANTAVFLCSTAASFITGSNLVVDGGWTGRVNY